MDDDDYELEQIKRPFRCHDRMCGQLDCKNCHPEYKWKEEENE